MTREAIRLSALASQARMALIQNSAAEELSVSRSIQAGCTHPETITATQPGERSRRRCVDCLKEFR